MKKEKGITLVALVVTIVVLLILAGITIVYVFGDNGVFGQASEAKLKTDIANWQERLEMAKSPVFIEGLGTFDPDKYFTYIQQQGIINNKDTDVIDNEDGTYDVTTKPGYVFLVTLMPNPEKPTDAQIEYIGQAGKLKPTIRGITVTGKTKTSIDIKVSARLEGGTIKSYYKKLSEVAEGEAINSIEGYTEVTMNGVIGSITGLTAGEIYKIKAVLQKDGEDIGWVSIEEKTVPPNPVESITLDKTTATIEKGGTLQLTATVKPDNADDKTVTWSASPTSVATVDQTGKVTGVVAGETTVTVTANDGSGITATCEVTVVVILNKDTMGSEATDWEAIDRIAKAIAKDSTVTNSSTTATGTTEQGEKYEINVGETYKVKYDGTEVRVRVLGFKHDDLVNKGAYGGNHSKASISFEFYDFMTGSTYKSMNSSGDNTGGWGATQMRKDLNGYTTSDDTQSGVIGGEGAKLSNKSYIKQVKKQYIKTYDSASSNQNYTQDYLWLLASSEIVKDGFKTDYYIYAIATEGSQYQYYKTKATEAWNETSEGRTKYNASGVTFTWWLRSPKSDRSWDFCHVREDGWTNSSSFADYEAGVAPGFAI